MRANIKNNKKGTWLEIFAEIARFLEELLKMSLAVQNSIHGWIVAHLPYTSSSTVSHTMSIVSTCGITNRPWHSHSYIYRRSNTQNLSKNKNWTKESCKWNIYIYHKGAFAMGAFEARLVVGHSFNGQHVHHIDCLIANIAFVGCSCERHFFCFLFLSFLGFFFCVFVVPRLQDPKWIRSSDRWGSN